MLPGTTASQRWQPRVSASYAAVAATLLTFALISSFYVVVPGRFKNLGGGPAPAQEMARCLSLAYRGIDGQGLPAFLRLTGEVSSWPNRGGPLYSAIITESGGQLEWRPAGPDSIDVTSYSRPMMIRLPARGQRTVGRVARQGYHNMIWAALLAAPDGQVFASEVRCSPVPHFSPDFID